MRRRYVRTCNGLMFWLLVGWLLLASGAWIRMFG